MTDAFVLQVDYQLCFYCLIKININAIKFTSKFIKDRIKRERERERDREVHTLLERKKEIDREREGERGRKKEMLAMRKRE